MRTLPRTPAHSGRTRLKRPNPRATGDAAVSCTILNTVSDRPEPEYLQPPVRADGPLADRRWDYIQDYADAKSSVVEEIISRAKADQRPGPA